MTEPGSAPAPPCHDRPAKAPSGRRVVLLTTSFPRHDGDAAGHFVAAEARLLHASGCEVHVVAAGGRLRSAPERRDGVTLWRAGGGDAFGAPGIASRLRARPWRPDPLLRFAAGAQLRLQRLGRQAPIDELIAHWWLPCAWPLALGSHAPLTAVGHGADIRLLCALPGPLRNTLTRWLLRRCSVLRLVAHALRDELCATLPPTLAEELRRRVQVAPCAIDIPPRQDTGQVVARSEQAPLIVAVGRLVASKRLPLLLQALAHSRPAARCIIVGDGPERARLTRLCKTLQLTEVSFAGQLPRPQALDLIAAADLLVSCSDREGAPTVVREARALGTPVLATPAGDIARWAAQDDGIELVAPEVSALGRALSRHLQQRGPIRR